MYTTLLTAMLIAAPPQPTSSFAPVLHVRLISPANTMITVRPGLSEARVYQGTADFAVRPGYTQRLALMARPDDPTSMIYPTLEVRASLFLPANLHGSDFPALVRVTEDDMQRVFSGGMVTRVIYLEDPEKAIPTQSTIDEPLERDALIGEDPIDAARKRGRVLAILRLGGRHFSREELALEDIDGVVQQTGEALGPPACPPTIPAQSFQLFDPIAGPKIPEEELIKDGGDIGPRIGIGANSRVGNLNVTDTAAEFRFDGQGRRTTTSNRICLFAPRFAAIRQDLSVAAFDGALPPLATTSAAGLTLHRTRQPSQSIHENTQPKSVLARVSLRGARSREGLHGIDSSSGPLVIGRVDGLAVRSTFVDLAGLTQYRDQCKPNEPLVLVKSAEPREAKPGDVVTVTLKFINYGSKPARDLIVSDSLSPRLEYIPGTSCGDRPTVFTYEPNQSGSATLQWAVHGELPPGQSGVVQFQVKVR